MKIYTWSPLAQVPSYFAAVVVDCRTPYLEAFKVVIIILHIISYHTPYIISYIKPYHIIPYHHRTQYLATFPIIMTIILCIDIININKAVNEMSFLKKFLELFVAMFLVWK